MSIVIEVETPTPLGVLCSQCLGPVAFLPGGGSALQTPFRSLGLDFLVKVGFSDGETASDSLKDVQQPRKSTG